MNQFEDHDCRIEYEDDDIIKQFIDGEFFISIRRNFRSWFMINRIHPKTMKYFKSHCSRRDEQIRHLVHYYYIIHPFSRFSLYWEFFMFLVLSCHYVIIPLNASIVFLDTDHIIYTARFIFEVLYLCDIVKMFFTGYYNHDKSRVVFNFTQISRRYLLTFFIPDLVSCTHFFVYIVKIFTKMDPVKIFPFRIFERLKIIRLPRYLKAVELFRKYKGYSSYLFRGIRLVLIFLVVTFWAFSCHFFVNNYFVLYQKKDNITEAWESRIYKVMFQAASMLLLVNLQDGIRYILEYVDVIVFSCFGFTLQLFVSIQILHVWKKYTNSEDRHESLHKQFSEYMKYKELPISLRHRMFTYFQYRFHKNFFKEIDINNMVSSLLKQEIILHVTRKHIERVEFFKHLPEIILTKVVSQLRTEYFLPGDVIISAGRTGSTMFFIYHGTVAVYTPSGKEICHLEDGAHFGEIALVLSETRVATVVAVTACEMFVLRRSDFLGAVEPYSQYRDQIVALATERLHGTITQPVADKNR